MSRTSEQTKIIIDKESGPVVINGLTIEFNAQGDVDVHWNVPVTVPAPANDSDVIERGKSFDDENLEPGDKMEDGTIFAGISPDTGQNMFVPPRDLSGTFNWEAGKKAAENLEAHGHNDYTLPSKAELDVIYQNRDKIGGFNQGGSIHAGWYWSSTQHSYNRGHAWQQRFSDGTQSWYVKYADVSVRPVRAELRPS